MSDDSKFAKERVKIERAASRFYEIIVQESLSDGGAVAALTGAIIGFVRVRKLSAEAVLPFVLGSVMEAYGVEASARLVQLMNDVVSGAASKGSRRAEKVH